MDFLFKLLEELGVGNDQGPSVQEIGKLDKT